MNLAAYFHYATSSIDGSTSDQPVPGLPEGVAAWENPTRHIVFGVVAYRPGDFKATYWRDNTGMEHPDAWRDVNITLAPGQVYAPQDPPIAVFGAFGDRSKVIDLANRIRAEGRLAVLVR